MFNDEQQFFPTPREVVSMMLRPYFSGATSPHMVLDPSAGKGDILDWFKNRYERPQLLAIEIDPELRHILHGKKYKVIEADFLAYGGEYRPALIAMNPPFNDGVAHLLHAWNTLHGGDIVCLLNAESIRNPYSEARKLLAHIIEAHGSVEFIGQAFKWAERPTDVEIALVRLHKEAPPLEFSFAEGQFEQEARVDDEAFAANPLAHHDLLASMVDQYNAAVRVVWARHKLAQELTFYTQATVDPARPWARCKIETSDPHEDIERSKEVFWNYVFNKTRLGEITTSDFQERFQAFKAQTGSMAFSLRNVREVLRLFFENRDQIMEQCLLEVFDKGTAFHEKNCVHIEGWKTNKAYRLNQRIIVPYGISYDGRFGSGHWSINYRNSGFYRDLDKVMCHLSGRDMGGIVQLDRALSDAVTEANRGGDYTKPVETTFFKVRFWKKGTLHIDFLDPFLLRELNMRAAQGKNWLGGGY